MSEDMKRVYEYLTDTKGVLNTGVLVDRLLEMYESYETVPECVLDAFSKLTESDRWEIIRLVAAHSGHRVLINTGG